MASHDGASRCCERCFKDPVLLETIEEEGEPGDCPVCGSIGVKTVAWSVLTEHFQIFVDSHVTSSSGEFLWTLLGEWGVFGPGLEGNPEGQREVVVGILEEGVPSDPSERYLDHPDYRTGLFAPAGGGVGDLADSWESAMLSQIRPPRLSLGQRLKIVGWKLHARIRQPRLPDWLVPGDAPDSVAFALEDLGIESRVQAHPAVIPAQSRAMSPPCPQATGGCRLTLHQLSGSRSERLMKSAIQVEPRMARRQNLIEHMV